MAKVFLDFVPPNDVPDLTTLHIYEGATPDGPFNEIEAVTPVGEMGGYLSYYSTIVATDANNWFTIKWENIAGVFTDYAEAIQGGTRTVLSDLISRVLLRNPSMNEQIVAEEAEAVIEGLYHTPDPLPSLVTAKYMSGMTLLVLARVQLMSLTAQKASQWTAGLVSMKSGTNQTYDSVKQLLDEAARMLGMNVSIVAQMTMPEIAGGLSTIVSADISRLQIEVE